MNTAMHFENRASQRPDGMLQTSCGAFGGEDGPAGRTDRTAAKAETSRWS